MFEKEAEERFVKSYPEFCYNGKLSPYWDLWQDGAEFGYNKGKEDVKEELDKYRNMGFDKMEQLTKAKEIIFTLLDNFAYPIEREDWTAEDVEIVDKAEQFLKEAEK